MLLTIRKKNAATAAFILTHDNGAIHAESEGGLSDKRKKEWAKICGVSVAQLGSWLLEVMAAQIKQGDDKPTKQFTVPGPAEVQPAKPPEPFSIRIRGVTQTAAEATVFTGTDPAAVLTEALSYKDHPVLNPVIEWDDIDALCVLDIDYHTVSYNDRLSNDHLKARAAEIQPSPIYRHVSHGRGMKLYYVAQHGFTARNLAGAAAWAWLGADMQATAELKSTSRHPAYPRIRANVRVEGPAPLGGGYPTITTHEAAPGGIEAGVASVDIAAVGAFFQKTVSDNAIDEFLNSKGVERGHKYSHDYCCIAPGIPSASAPPVLYGTTGVYCHKCAGEGRTRYRGKPGFVSYAQLVGQTDNLMRPMIQHMCHWYHARIVVQHVFGNAIPDNVLRPAYEAVLKAVHGVDNPGVAAAMTAARDIVRLDGAWGNLDGNYLSKSAKAIIGSLPATWKIDRIDDGANPPEWEVEKLATEVEQFTLVEKMNLKDRGYAPITLLPGARVWGEKLNYTDARISYNRPGIEFLSEHGGGRSPRYVPPSRRMKLADARRHIEASLPGICWPYVEMAIVSKGYAEGNAAQAPFILAHGISQSGKSTAIHLAASIIGDRASEINWVKDTTRFFQSVAEGVVAGSFVVLNELFKMAQIHNTQARASLDPLLNVTKDSLYHRMYVGPVALGRLPVMIVTDVELPPEVGYDVQLGRRFINCELPAQRVDWQPTLTPIGGAARYRLHSDENAAACDAVYSSIVDRFFSCVGNYHEAAGELGFKTIERSPEFADKNDNLARFYSLLQTAPDATDYDAPKGAGWKRISLAAQGSLENAWANISTDRVTKRHESRALKERDLCSLFGVDRKLDPTGMGIAVDIVPRESEIYLRFRMGAAECPVWLNGKLCSSASANSAILGNLSGNA